jgi:DNA-binding CsgD family transcriptional regulator
MQYAIDLDFFALPTLVIDAQAVVLRSSRSAAALLQADDSALHIEQGRFCANAAEAQARLMHLVGRATRVQAAAHADFGARGMLLPREGRLPLTLSIAPFHGERPGDSRAALVTLRDPHHATIDLQLLQDLFGLTPTEARVAAAVADGQAVPHIAAGMHVQANTVQAHIKRVLVKTGTRRQAQMATLLLRSVAAGSVQPCFEACGCTAANGTRTV